MSVQLDDVFDEPPGVVAVVLSHAIEEAGWHLVSVSRTGDEVVWEVDDPARGRTRLCASITPDGEGARVRVASVDVAGWTTGQAADPPGATAEVIELRPRTGGGPGGPLPPAGPGTGPSPFGPA